MKNIILIIFIGFLFTGCSMSSLEITKNKNLVLDVDSKEFILSSEVKEHKLLNYKDLFIEQYRVQNEEGKVLFYENAYTSLNYEFNHGSLFTVMYIFNDSREYEKVYESNNLIFVQLLLENKKYINVLIKSSDTQVLSYVYGFSNEEFLALVNKLNTDKTKKIELKYNAISSFSKPLTNWNANLVFFTPLITPLRMIGKF